MLKSIQCDFNTCIRYMKKEWCKGEGYDGKILDKMQELSNEMEDILAGK